VKNKCLNKKQGTKIKKKNFRRKLKRKLIKMNLKSKIFLKNFKKQTIQASKASELFFEETFKRCDQKRDSRVAVGHILL